MKFRNQFKPSCLVVCFTLYLSSFAYGSAKEPPTETKAAQEKLSTQATTDVKEQPEVFGWVERVQIESANVSVKAKLDTGAKTSSLDARNIRVVRQGKKRYVRFDFIDPETKKIYPMKLPRIRGVSIVRHNGNHQRRHVVELDVCLGQHKRTIEVSLIDRSNFIYPLLIGRRALKDIALIHSGETFLQVPSCVLAEDPKDSNEKEVLEDPEKLDYQDDAENDDEAEVDATKETKASKK